MSLRRLTPTVLGALMVAVLAAAAAPVAAHPRADAKAVRTFTIPGDAVFPEGVAFDARTGNFFVSSTTDGTVFRGNLRRPALEAFLPGGADGRTTAIGLKVDRRGLLYVSGGGTGQMWVYDTRTRRLVAHFDTGLRQNTFINDAAVTKDGDAFFTDSLTPVLWRVPAKALRHPSDEVRAPDAFLNFTGTPAAYQPGFNLNGIAASRDGRHLLTIQSNTGKLFRIDLAGHVRRVAEVSVEGGPLTNGDGLVLEGSLLFVLRNQQELIVTVKLDGRLRDGRVIADFTDPALQFPTTAARAHDRLLVVNSQFDKRGPGLTPELPFTVASVPIVRVLRD